MLFFSHYPLWTQMYPHIHGNDFYMFVPLYSDSTVYILIIVYNDLSNITMSSVYLCNWVDLTVAAAAFKHADT